MTKQKTQKTDIPNFRAELPNGLVLESGGDYQNDFRNRHCFGDARLTRGDVHRLCKVEISLSDIRNDLSDTGRLKDATRVNKAAKDLS